MEKGEQDSKGTLAAYACGCNSNLCCIFFSSVHLAVEFGDFGYGPAMQYFGPILLIKYFSLCQFIPTYILVAREQYISVLSLYIVAIAIIGFVFYCSTSARVFDVTYGHLLSGDNVKLYCVDPFAL